jgi:hypothetical protein
MMVLCSFIAVCTGAGQDAYCRAVKAIQSFGGGNFGGKWNFDEKILFLFEKKYLRGDIDIRVDI